MFMRSFQLGSIFVNERWRYRHWPFRRHTQSPGQSSSRRALTESARSCHVRGVLWSEFLAEGHPWCIWKCWRISIPKNHHKNQTWWASHSCLPKKGQKRKKPRDIPPLFSCLLGSIISDWRQVVQIRWAERTPFRIECSSFRLLMIKGPIKDEFSNNRRELYVTNG